jgi:hypothetical protein
MAKTKKSKSPSYDPFADLLGLPATNHAKKKAVVKIAKQAPVVKELNGVVNDLRNLFKF